MSDLHGFDSELAKKAAAKYDLNAEKEACEWLQTLSGQTCVVEEGQSLVDILRSGVILCKAITRISPGVIPKPFNPNPKHFMEEQGNITMYLTACAQLGVPSQDLFTIRDVGTSRPDKSIVLQNIFALGRQAQCLRAPVPQLGVTFHKSMEDIARIEHKRMAMREQELIKAQTEQKRGSDRRIHLEDEKRNKTNQKVMEIKNKMIKRQSDRKSRNRDSLGQRRTKRPDTELERSPSPIRFGMDLEHANRMDMKKNDNAEESVLDWVEDITQEEVDDVYLHLKSGRTLCRLLNKIYLILGVPLEIKFSTSTRAIHEMGNIKKFIESLAFFNIKPAEAFDVQDLYKSRNLLLVIKTLVLLASRVEAHPKYNGPKLDYTERPPEVISDPNLAGHFQKRKAEKEAQAEDDRKKQEEIELKKAELLRLKDLQSSTNLSQIEPKKPYGWGFYITLFALVSGICGASYYYKQPLLAWLNNTSNEVSDLIEARFNVNIMKSLGLKE